MTDLARTRLSPQNPSQRWLAFLCSMCGAVGQLAGQPGEPVVRIRTELVELQVVVTDRKGQPVAGLEQEDFALLVGGLPREIGFFSETRLAASPPSGSVDNRPRGSLETPGRQATEAPRRTVLLFVDTLHLCRSSLIRVKKSLRQFLDEQVGDQDLVAIVSTAKRLGITGQFTRNPHVLRYAVDQLSQGLYLAESLFTPFIAAGVERGERDALQVGGMILQMEEGVIADAALLELLTRETAVRVLSEATYRRQATLGTLQAAAEQMAGLPGQRLLVIYSDGFSLMDRFGTVDSVDLREAVNRAVRSGVVVYSIDGKGLQPPPLFSAMYGRADLSGTLFSYLTSSERDLEDGMNLLARDTGGETFFNTNDLTGALADTLDSNRHYYVLGFYPAEEEQGKGFRKFQVFIRDHPEYRVRTQKGYAPREGVKPGDEDWNSTPEKRFHKAVLDPLPVTDLGVFAWADFLETSADDAQVSLHVHIDGARVRMKPQEDGYGMDLEMMAYVLNRRGKSLESKIHRIQGKLQQPAVEDIRNNGLYVSKRLSLEPGLYQLRVGVREKETERIGTAVAWVEVPRLSKKKVVLSSLTLADGPRRGNLLEESSPAEGWAGSRFRDGLQFYRRGESFNYLAVVYPASKGGPDSDLLMKAEILRDGEPIAPAVYRPLSARLLGQDEKGSIIGGEVELTGIGAGLYELLLSVREGQSERTVTRSTVFGVD